MTNHSGTYFRQAGWLFGLLLVMLSLYGCTTPARLAPGEQLSVNETLALAGNAENGRKLFMGSAHFQHDGPPCMGCHNVGENGLLGGGALGPNLTNVSTRRSQAEILGILSNTESVISPVMQPIYTDTPLTAQEQADLLAFLGASVGQPESDKELLVIGISLAGFVAAVVLIGVVYRGRLRGVRKSLLKKAQSEQ
jgi:hypothetical protein